MQKTVQCKRPKRRSSDQDKKWFGFCLHLTADATYEIPVAFSATKASNSEQTETKKLLEKIEKIHNEWLESCKYFLGDKVYDSGNNITLLKQLGTGDAKKVTETNGGEHQHCGSGVVGEHGQFCGEDLQNYPYP